MPRLTKIYTRTGDDGTTALGGGQRVPKDAARVTACGTVDELNSAIGVALAHGLSPRLADVLPVIQNELFHLGSDLAFVEADKVKHGLPQIVTTQPSLRGTKQSPPIGPEIASQKALAMTQAKQLPQIEERHIDQLERWIDEFNEVVGPLENFILPGGSIGAAHLHVARAICRRAERAVVTLAREEPIGAWVAAYLNRLSDLLFVIARYENKQRGVVEPLWNSRL